MRLSERSEESVPLLQALGKKKEINYSSIYFNIIRQFDTPVISLRSI